MFVYVAAGPAEETQFNYVNITLPELVGREYETERLVDGLLSSPGAVHDIEGLVGIGKTTLALAACKKYCDQVERADSSSSAYRCYMVEFPLDLKHPQELYDTVLTQVFGSQFCSPDLGPKERNFHLQLCHMCKGLYSAAR